MGLAVAERQPLRIRLTLDSGLAAYIRALVAGIGIYGDERETIIYLIRSGVLDHIKSENFRETMLPHLPDDIQRAWGRRP